MLLTTYCVELLLKLRFAIIVECKTIDTEWDQEIALGRVIYFQKKLNQNDTVFNRKK